MQTSRTSLFFLAAPPSNTAQSIFAFFADRRCRKSFSGERCTALTAQYDITRSRVRRIRLRMPPTSARTVEHGEGLRIPSANCASGHGGPSFVSSPSGVQNAGPRERASESVRTFVIPPNVGFKTLAAVMVWSDHVNCIWPVSRLSRAISLKMHPGAN